MSVVERVGFKRGDSSDALLEREWLVTNGLGGYACGSLGGVLTRRFHGLLVAALPAPLGRTMMLNQLREALHLPNGESACLTGQEFTNDELDLPSAALDEFVLEDGLPIWRYAFGGVQLEKRVFMPHLKNTTIISYRLLRAPAAVRLHLHLGINVRRHEGQLQASLSVDEHGHVVFPYAIRKHAQGLEIDAGQAFPPLRLRLEGPGNSGLVEQASAADLLYRIERSRGYDFHGSLFTPGYYEVALEPGKQIALQVSTEAWSDIGSSAADALNAERKRRRHLLDVAHPKLQTGFGAELVLAADQFVIVPTRTSNSKHEELRSVIAGYHWFTDWGRDTMISLEGLTLLVGRRGAARDILRTFAQHTKNGLIPNLFPEGGTEGLYHTADATLWFFHALSRYEKLTGDSDTRKSLMRVLLDIMRAHLAGTDFGIGVDPKDGLLRQGAEGYQLTWMDAKVDGWVVTPRRGKAVELNALFYNALRLMQEWLDGDGEPARAAEFGERAERARISFNQRFWYDAGGYLYDVIDGPDDPPEARNDAAFRPNQLLAIALPHPVLDPSRWKPVVESCQKRLLTPAGLRSLAPGHPDYKPRYDGDLRARDAAYHQGTVWAWLIGPFFDAWLKVHPEDRVGARELIARFDAQLGEACIGSISEIFDAEAPFCSRGCVAQAWSIAEVLRAFVISET